MARSKVSAIVGGLPQGTIQGQVVVVDNSAPGGYATKDISELVGGGGTPTLIRSPDGTKTMATTNQDMTFTFSGSGASRVLKLQEATVSSESRLVLDSNSLGLDINTPAGKSVRVNGMNITASLAKLNNIADGAQVNPAAFDANSFNMTSPSISNLSWSERYASRAKYTLMELVRNQQTLLPNVSTAIRGMSPMDILLIIAHAQQADPQTPPGTMAFWPATDAPKGWVLADGSAYEIVHAKRLYDVIGRVYTEHGLGPAWFRVPDVRGYFPRFSSLGRTGRDPDKDFRIARPDGASGDTVGTTQGDEVGSHSHAVGRNASGGGNGKSALQGTQGYGAGDGNNNTYPAGGNETRPKNIYLTGIIKL